MSDFQPVKNDPIGGYLPGRSFHRVVLFDAGRDDAKPGRWLAETNWLAPTFAGYGAAPADAYQALAEQVRERRPGTAPWFGQVPVVLASTGETVDPDTLGTVP